MLRATRCSGEDDDHLGVMIARAAETRLPERDQHVRDAATAAGELPGHGCIEVLALRHQITVLRRHLNGQRVQYAPGDRAFLTALLHDLPKEALLRMRLPVRPDTIPRRHRDLVA